MDLIATTNDSKSVFVDTDDRRIEMVKCNPYFKNNKEFWSQFYKDVEDINIMSTFFHYLKEYPIQLDVRSDTCRFSLKGLSEQKLNSMKISHRFFIEHFVDRDCFESACHNPRVETSWFNSIQFQEVQDTRQVFIGKKKLYQLFQHYCRTTGVKISMRLSTFYDQIEDIKIVESRQMIIGSRISGFILEPTKIRKDICAYYKVDEDLIPMDWAMTEDLEFEQLQTSTFRFRDFGQN